jgi:hypothetical protein
MNAYQALKAPQITGVKIPAVTRPSFRESEPLCAILWLDTNGYVCDCNSVAVKQLGCEQKPKEPLHVSALLPQLKEMKLNDGCHINSHLRYIAHLGHRFEAFSVDGERFEVELFFSEVEQPAPYAFRVIIGLHSPVQRIFSVK